MDNNKIDEVGDKKIIFGKDGDTPQENIIVSFFNNHLDRGLKKFNRISSDFLKRYNVEIDTEADFIDAVFEEIVKLVDIDVAKYGGYAFFFTKIAYKYDHSLSLDSEMYYINAYEWDYLVESKKTPVTLVCEQYPEKDFIPVFITKMTFTLMSVCSQTDKEDLAELIFSSDVTQYVFETEVDNWVGDIVYHILEYLGYPDGEYEVENDNGSIIYPKHFNGFTMDMCFDAHQLAQDIIDSYE